MIALADKAYDADRIRALVEEQGATPNMPAAPLPSAGSFQQLYKQINRPPNAKRA